MQNIHNNVNKIHESTLHNAHITIVGIAQCTHNNIDEIHELTLHNARTTITSENEFQEESLKVQEWFNKNGF